MIAYSAPVEITAIAALFFIILALIALARALYVKVRPPKRWAVGVFVERDREPEAKTEDEDTKIIPPRS